MRLCEGPPLDLVIQKKLRLSGDRSGKVLSLLGASLLADLSFEFRHLSPTCTNTFRIAIGLLKLSLLFDRLQSGTFGGFFPAGYPVRPNPFSPVSKENSVEPTR